VFSINGYFPDGGFTWNLPNAGYQNWPNFTTTKAAGVFESHGSLLTGAIFANALTPPASYTSLLAPADTTLAPASSAIDRGLILPNINDGFTGSAPDLGALEAGCPAPIYLRPASHRH
jgi:hypothetical protein